MSYALVRFMDGSGTAIVPTIWAEECDKENMKTDGIIEVAYPPRESYNKMRTYLKRKINPDPLWESYAAQVLYISGKQLNYFRISLPLID